jgi:L-threonylcarbamoyladenylate synthase
VLAAGGVLLLATDTLPGLHARVDRPEAVRRVAALKGRPGDKPLLVLAASAAAAVAVTGVLDTRQTAYANRCWPGPFSLVLPAAPDLTPAVTAGGGTVAVRVPGHRGLIRLLETVGTPVVSTSANRAGEAPARSLTEAELRFADQVDGIFDPGNGGGPGDRASALIDLVVWPPRVLREGPQPAPPPAGGDLDPAGGES